VQGSYFFAAKCHHLQVLLSDYFSKSTSGTHKKLRFTFSKQPQALVNRNFFKFPVSGNKIKPERFCGAVKNVTDDVTCSTETSFVHNSALTAFNQM